MTKSQDSKLRRSVAREHGLCNKCQKRDAELGKARCLRCSTHEYNKREQCRLDGTCSRCLRRPARENRKTCQFCADHLKSAGHKRVKITRTAKQYVSALRRLQEQTARRDINPQGMAEVRNNLQGVIRELFSVVEGRV